MFFPERVTNVKPGELVLEIGPGSNPHPRSNVLLEHTFSPEEAEAQRGRTEPLKTDKKVVYYEGSRFPFKDKEFDYVICSHVLEHIPAEALPGFISELSRVASRGYLEFPAVYYDFIFDIPEHTTLLFWDGKSIRFMPKSEAFTPDQKQIRSFFFKALNTGYLRGMLSELETFIFQGFEWQGSVPVKKVGSMQELGYDVGQLTFPPLQKNDSKGLLELVKGLFRPLKRLLLK